jgi:hypothetical protein
VRGAKIHTESRCKNSEARIDAQSSFAFFRILFYSSNFIQIVLCVLRALRGKRIRKKGTTASLGKRLSAMGAEPMFCFSRLAASGADGERVPARALGIGLTVFLENSSAAAAFQKTLTPLDRNEWNKEKA